MVPGAELDQLLESHPVLAGMRRELRGLMSCNILNCPSPGWSALSVKPPTRKAGRDQEENELLVKNFDDIMGKEAVSIFDKALFDAWYSTQGITPSVIHVLRTIAQVIRMTVGSKLPLLVKRGEGVVAQAELRRLPFDPPSSTKLRLPKSSWRYDISMGAVNERWTQNRLEGLIAMCDSLVFNFLNGTWRLSSDEEWSEPAPELAPAPELMHLHAVFCDPVELDCDLSNLAILFNRWCGHSRPAGLQFNAATCQLFQSTF